MRRLAKDGNLIRGLRAVIAHQVLFHWNRMGLPASTQTTLARAAAHVAFAGPRDLARDTRKREASAARRPALNGNPP